MPNAMANAEIIKSQLRGSCLLAMSIWNDQETTSLAEKYGASRNRKVQTSRLSGLRVDH
jgi:hypothetical protein